MNCLYKIKILSLEYIQKPSLELNQRHARGEDQTWASPLCVRLYNQLFESIQK